MIDSMTGFARANVQGEWGEITWECRCVNHRYLEVSLKIPEALRPLELKIREMIKLNISRGKLECSARFQSSPSLQSNFVVNQGLLDALVKAEQSINEMIASPRQASAHDWMRWPEMLIQAPIDYSEHWDEMLVGLNGCLSELKEVRAHEGAALDNLIRGRLTELKQIAETVKPLVPASLEALREKMMLKMKDLAQEGDATRLEQEMVLWAQKVDIDEELDRLFIHCEAVENALSKGSPAGRRLDFLMQELNREANTLSSKSQDLEISQKAVDMKVLIEQMREQVQNVD
ncbi:MAG: YicC family protein [Legionellales bacterium]|nr:YicC family protein [Legionellales bacterium]